MQDPGFITVNGLRIKIQRWLHNEGEIRFSTVIRGAHLGNDLAKVIRQSEVTLTLDDSTSWTGRAQLLDRRESGEGVKAVTRLEILFTYDGSDDTSEELTADQKLDAILAELRVLRREVASLREPSAPVSGNVGPLRPGTTLLDFEIPTDDETD